MIKLNNNWVIDSDGCQYILKQDTGAIDKRGEKVYRSTSYHASVEQALCKLIKMEQMNYIEENEITLKEAINKFQEINDRLIRELHEAIKG